MSLKELTLHQHRAAEQTRFMQAVIQKQLPTEVWTDFIFQKTLIYKGLEGLAGAYCGCNQVPDLYRAFLLYQDFKELSQNQQYNFKKSTLEYYDYIQTLAGHPNRIMAHVYVWHMGDLFGGQMIRRLTPGSNLALQFDNKDTLVAFIRSKCDDSMAEEANLAFEYAIKIMNELF